MRIRAFEVAAAVAVVAAIVAYEGSGHRARQPVALSTPAAMDTGIPQNQATPAAVKAEASHLASEQYPLWKALYDEAQAMLGQGDNKRAEARLVEALKLAPLVGPEATHETLDDLGLVCYRLGEYDRCAAYQKRAIETASQLPEPQRSAVQGLYETRLATALQSLKRHDDALAALGRARSLYRAAYPAGSPAYSEALNGLAAQYRSFGDNEGAARVVEDL